MNGTNSVQAGLCKAEEIEIEIPQIDRERRSRDPEINHGTVVNIGCPSRGKSRATASPRIPSAARKDQQRFLQLLLIVTLVDNATV